MSSLHMWTAVMAVSLVAGPGCGRGQAEVIPVSPPVVRVAAVSAVSASPARMVHGVTRADEEAALAFAEGGRVATRLVSVGQAVRTGDPLVRLDRRPLTSGARALAGRKAELQVRAEQVARDLDRLERLAETNGVSERQLDQVRSEGDALQASIAAVDGQLAGAQWSVARGELQAPFDGTVTAVSVEPGEVVGAGRPVVVVRGLGRVEVELQVPARLRHALEPGTPVVVHEAMDRQQTLTGRVETVGAAATGGALFPVLVSLGAENVVPPGVPVTVELPQPEVEDAVSVPLSALVAPSGEGAVVGRVTDGSAELVPVDVVAVHGARVAVRGALSVGDDVVVRGQAGLVDGATVTVRR